MKKMGYFFTIISIMFLMVACSAEEKTVDNAEETKKQEEESKMKMENETNIDDSKINELTNFNKEMIVYIEDKKMIMNGEFDSVKIRSGVTGEDVANIKNAELEQLLDELASVKFEQDEYEAKTGWSYSVEFIEGNSSVTLLLSSNEIVDNDNEARYVCQTNLDELIEKYIK